MKKISLPVKGMYCSHCAKAVEDSLSKVGAKGKVDLTHNQVTLTYDEKKTSLELLKRAVKRAGYTLVIEEEKKKFDYSLVLTGVSIAVLILSLLGMIHHLGVHNSFFALIGSDLSFFILATVSILILGIPFFIRAFKGLLYKNIGMDFLISFSALVSYGLSIYIMVKNISLGYYPNEMHMQDPGYLMTYFDAASMTLSIITLGHRVIDSIKTKAAGNYKKENTTGPVTAHLIHKNGKIDDVDADFIDVDDKIQVLAGELIPVDGTCLSGPFYVDESSLTGESNPRVIYSGDKVYGGTVLMNGPLSMKADKIALDSLYSGIMNESYVLDEKKGQLYKISDRIALIFTPAILLISLIAFFICYFGLGIGVEQSIIRSVSVLSVSCPCAFGLAVPIASMSGYDLSMKHGILFKSGDTFEKVRKIKAIVFDKTGTLSQGLFSLVGREGDDSYLALVKALEKKSRHPLSKAFLTSFSQVEDISLEGEVKEIPGVGLSYDKYLLGNQTTVKDKKVSDALRSFIDSNKDNTIVYLSDDKEIISAFALADILKEDARQTIKKLTSLGIKCYMLTGDRKEYAYRQAEIAGIDRENVYYEMTPTSKAEVLRQIRKKNGNISYVGDGINDALALKESDLSFASYQGSSLALSSADALLLKPELSIIVDALLISRKTYLIIIENFIWAILYNVCMIPLAIMGYLLPSLGALLMIFSNLTLTVNSLRLRLYKPDK